MQEKIVLSIDVGTQSTRAFLINQFGDILGQAKSDHLPSYFSKEADWAEQEADFYWENVALATQKLKESKLDIWDKIEGVGITTIRGTYVCLDKNKKPIRPAFLWMDKRKASGSPELSWWMKAALKISGMEKTAFSQWRISISNWLKQNELDNWHRTTYFSFLSGYLIYCLTGNLVDSISALVGYVPFNFRKRNWMSKIEIKRFIFDIELSKLPQFKETGQILGRISQEASDKTGIPAGLPLFATGSDKGCETVGMGCTTPEKAAISFGTASTISITLDKYIEPEKFMPAYLSMIKGAYNPEIQIYRGYWLVSWFKKEFAEKEVRQAEIQGISAEELLNKRLQEIPAGCQGLVFQPYFTPNLEMPVAKGAIIGFSDIHTRVHIYRAIIEGINFALLRGLRNLEKKSGVKVEEIYLAGGGSRSDEICQITANMFGLPAIRTQTNETSGIGCGMACFVGMGIYSTFIEAAEHMVKKVDVFTPDMQQHRIYNKIYQDIFMEIYDRLAPLYAKQESIQKKIKNLNHKQ